MTNSHRFVAESGNSEFINLRQKSSTNEFKYWSHGYGNVPRKSKSLDKGYGNWRKNLEKSFDRVKRRKSVIEKVAFEKQKNFDEFETKS